VNVVVRVMKTVGFSFFSFHFSFIFLPPIEQWTRFLSLEARNSRAVVKNHPYIFILLPVCGKESDSAWINHYRWICGTEQIQALEPAAIRENRRRSPIQVSPFLTAITSFNGVFNSIPFFSLFRTTRTTGELVFRSSKQGTTIFNIGEILPLAIS